MKKAAPQSEMNILVRVKEIVYDPTFSRVVARPQQQGRISDWDKEKIGQQSRYVMVLLEGNKVNRELPAWKLELI